MTSPQRARPSKPRPSPRSVAGQDTGALDWILDRLPENQSSSFDFIARNAYKAHGVALHQPTIMMVLQGTKRIQSQGRTVSACAGGYTLVHRPGFYDMESLPEGSGRPYRALVIGFPWTVVDLARRLVATEAQGQHPTGGRRAGTQRLRRARVLGCLSPGRQQSPPLCVHGVCAQGRKARRARRCQRGVDWLSSASEGLGQGNPDRELPAGEDLRGRSAQRRPPDCVITQVWRAPAATLSTPLAIVERPSPYRFLPQQRTPPGC